MHPDPGLFGPRSVTWRLHADPVAGVAGLRALLLQALHPHAMAAVASLSDFRDDPWGRLRRTAEYIGTITYGSCEDARRSAARVRGIHRRLGVDAPDQLLWVHACLVDSFVDTGLRSGILTPAEADEYVAEQVVSATLVGLHPAGVPGDVAALARYFEQVRPLTVATKQAREAARLILVPPMPAPVALTTAARPAWASVVALAFALQPEWARRRYRIPGVPMTDGAATLALRTLRLSLLAVPPAVREGPHLKAARARLDAA